MVIAYCILLALIVVGLRIVKPSDDDSFFDNSHCMPVKGICIASVFLGHAGGYLYTSGPDGLQGLERVFFFLNDNFGQLKVVPFLFISGYGVARCLESKGDAYLDSMPRRRIFRTLGRFDIAVLSFVALNLLLGIPMSIRQVGLSFVGWDSIGNSNWYIFVILICYVATWISGRVGRLFSLSSGKRNGLLWLILAAAMIALVFCRDAHWYNTMLAYPAGVLYAVYRDRFNRLFRGHFWLSVVVLGFLAAGVHVVTHYVSIPGGEVWYNLKGIAFAFFVVCLMTRIELRSIPLSWMGENLFEIYIYQRLPMIALMTLIPSTVFAHQGAFVLVSALVTVGIVFLIRLVKGARGLKA